MPGVIEWLIVGLFLRSTVSEPEPAPAPAPYDVALELYDAGDAEAAASVLDQALESVTPTAAHHVLHGWCRLRLDQLEAASDSFAAALQLEAGSSEAWAGIGLVQLRAGDPVESGDSLRRALEGDPENVDAWRGLARASERVEDIHGARDALARVLALDPSDAESAARLLELEQRVMEERAPRPAVPPGTVLEMPARARAARFEVRDGDGWKPLFIKGVNLGTALPGTYPAEFPDDEELYRQWFDQMSDMGANVVRLYTLHPPSLYRALRSHNLQRPERKLWLVQGVWTELPEDHDFDAPAFLGGFEDEIRRVIHAVHGNLELPSRPGHAHGVYDTDVSEDLLAWLLGREWEPYSVDAYNKLNSRRTRFRGRYIKTGKAQPIETWLARVSETTVAYETEYYGWQHPVGYTSWPTLDPLTHPTEATVEEEIAIRKRLGKPTERPILEYDNDRVNVDSTLLHATARFPAGLYASYHAYPYYPDFMVVDPVYAQVRDAGGISRYLGYLQDLKRHHGDQPVVIAEFGVPSSRGIAHLQPEGLHHGGHTTHAQGSVGARMFSNIDEAGLAGGILFAWMDEWFKKNWVVIDYESPPERNRLWLNVLDAEQNYGLLGAWPGADGWKILLDGNADDWRDVPFLYESEPREAGGQPTGLQVTSDEAYLYLALHIGSESRPIDWSRRQFWIGVDTYDADRGDHRFPAPAGTSVAIGMEFLLKLAGEQTRWLVDPPYDLFTNRYRRPYRSVRNDDGVFIVPYVETNRERFGRDGTRYPPEGYARGVLRRGSTDPAAAEFDSLADWFEAPDGSLIEARIPWGFLNVGDPSSRSVIHESKSGGGTVATRETDGFRFHVLALDVSSPEIVSGSLPVETPALEHYPVYRWQTWEVPRYHLQLKKSYYVLQEALRGIPAHPSRR